MAVIVTIVAILSIFVALSTQQMLAESRVQTVIIQYSIINQ